MKDIRRMLATLIPLVLFTPLASADFTGIMEARMTAYASDGNAQHPRTLRYFISHDGVRCETDVAMPGGGNQVMVILYKFNPDAAYIISDEDRTYFQIDPAEALSAAHLSDHGTLSVRKIGSEKLLGYNTTHVIVTRPSGTEELWVTDEVLDYASYKGFQKAFQDDEEMKALKEAGALGLALKWISHPNDGAGMAMEVTRVEKMAVSPSAFEIPDGYTLTEVPGATGMGSLPAPPSGGAQQQGMTNENDLEDELKKLPPEQREMIRKMTDQNEAQ